MNELTKKIIAGITIAILAAGFGWVWRIDRQLVEISIDIEKECPRNWFRAIVFELREKVEELEKEVEKVKSRVP